MKSKFKRYFMNCAKGAAELSHAVRLKVGAVVVKDGNVISIGYNGMPPGWDNCCEHEIDGKLVTNPEVTHAEMNAIGKLAASTESAENATMFITHAPCIECAKMIHRAGIKQVYFNEYYRDSRGLEYLGKSGIFTNLLSNDSLDHPDQDQQ